MTEPAAERTDDDSLASYTFDLPGELIAQRPLDERSGARLLVATNAVSGVEHRHVRDLPSLLRAGDVLVVNDSRTLPAALAVRRADGRELRLHLSTPCGERWVVELRDGGERFTGGAAGDELALPAGGQATLLAPYLAGARLWLAEIRTGDLSLLDYLERHGAPIRYGYIAGEWPLADYQTIFAAEPGSAEMPSAGRPFTHELVTALTDAGVAIATVTLHTGVSSQEDGEPPYPERYRVTAAAARQINGARRVIAVGTTVVRALETVARAGGGVAAGAGWTRHVVTPQTGVRAVDGLLTGWHEPDATHLLMLEAVGGRALVQRSYRAAAGAGYLWHEFGDVHLLLPR